MDMLGYGRPCRYFTRLVAGLGLALMALPASAATMSVTFFNEFETNAIYLWAVDIDNNLDLAGVVFGGAAAGDWTAFVDNGDQLYMAGSTVQAFQGQFQVTFDYGYTPWTFEWAEVLWNGDGTYVLQGAGTLMWTGSGWNANSSFTHTADIVSPVPLPETAFLLLSAVSLLLVGHRRKRRPGEGRSDTAAAWVPYQPASAGA